MLKFHFQRCLNVHERRHAMIWRPYKTLLVLLIGVWPVPLMSHESRLSVDVEFRDSITSVVSYSWIDTRASQAAQKLQSSRFSANPTPAVKKALDEDAALMNRLLQPNWHEPEGVSTFSLDGRDILIAKWNGAAQFPTVKSAAVWDDPDFDLFL